MPPEDEQPAPSRPPRSLWRWAGLIVISVAAFGLAGASTYQILGSTLFPPTPPIDMSCREGTRALYLSIGEARERAVGRTLPELDALAAFRDDLKPIWNLAPSVRALCEKDNDREALKALRSVEILRFAEERAVRYVSLDLTRVRWRAPRLVEALGSPTQEN